MSSVRLSKQLMHIYISFSCLPTLVTIIVLEDVILGSMYTYLLVACLFSMFAFENVCAKVRQRKCDACRMIITRRWKESGFRRCMVYGDVRSWKYRMIRSKRYVCVYVYIYIINRISSRQCRHQIPLRDMQPRQFPGPYVGLGLTH